jgi:hypothetical protein
MFLCSCMLLAYVRKTNLTQKLFSTVPSQKIERSCIIYMLVVFKSGFMTEIMQLFFFVNMGGGVTSTTSLNKKSLKIPKG